ncbi:unnamed protein product [Rotaria magnacalcarata]|uniref:YihY/virulence factor BrkB family protein n=2 Tax=Rotaria magnacalcarata TaxID=392030 RepID=A0A816TJL1_9BILA|nr:unnamed protein product [Rotaria magnacalcarata]
MMEAIKSSNYFKCVEKVIRPLRRFLNKFLDDWSLSFAAMLAYYLFISLLSMGVVVAGILGLVLRNDFDAQQYIKDKIINSIATDNSKAADLKKVIDFVTDRVTKEASGVLSIGTVFAIFGASRLFVAIDKCMCIIYRIPERGFIGQNLLAFAAVFIFILIMPIIIAISSVSSVLASIIPSEAGRIGTFAGQLGFAVIFLLFFYYFATIIIVGAQINAAFFENYQTLGAGLGTCVSRMHEEYDVGDLRTPLIDENNEPRSYTH